MTHSRSRQVVASLGLALVLVGAATTIAWRQADRAENSARLVVNNLEVRETLNRLLAAMSDVEASERGFLLTADPKFLASLEASMRFARMHQRNLGQLILDGQQTSHFRALEPLVARRLHLARRDVSLRQGAGLDEPARQAVISGDGLAAMEAVRAQLDRMQLTAQALRVSRADAALLDERGQRLLFVSVTGLGTVALVAVLGLARRENRIRLKAQSEVERFFTLPLDMLCVIGPGGCFERLSPAFTETLGYSTAELHGRRLGDLVHSDDRADTLAKIGKVRDGGPALKFENRCRGRDGSWRWLAWKAQAVPEEGLLYATARDVTERRRSQEKIVTAVVNRLEAFKAALDQHALVSIAGTNGKIAYVNDRFCAVSQYERSELLGQDHRVVNSGHHPKAFPQDLWNTIAGGYVWRGDIRNRKKDGTFYWVDTTIVPFLDGDGNVEQYVAIRADITKRKQAEEDILRLNADLQAGTTRLEEANRELESFSYSVSHDLRAPLRHVHGYLQMLQRDTAGQLSKKAQRYLNTIAAASVEMSDLIDDLLAFSRMSRAEMQESRVDLNVQVQHVIRELEKSTRKRNIVWRVDQLPPVVGDPPMLKQVLANLIGNAVKYSRQRNPARIDIGSTEPEDGRVAVFVRDNGAGFDMQYAHKLFGVFQRLHRSEEFEGTGIGLATVRRIVTRHAGQVWAESAVDQGATFTFTLRTAPSIEHQPARERTS